ncbi:MAG: hypothetical protein IPK58_25170 [Acidobacteria bacterium]|nr:hypothetical protein [Acidobacteriota bacterium]
MRVRFALGRRVGWGFDGHQINVAPHAFADANAFYSKWDRALLFGYFRSAKKPTETIFSCLSHDVVAHETTHAILDGLRSRFSAPSSPEQAGFHEGFSDVVALLSVFSLRDVVRFLLVQNVPSQLRKSRSEASDPVSSKNPNLIHKDNVSIEKLRESALFGLAKQMGQELSGVRGQALRRSLELNELGEDEEPYLDRPAFGRAASLRRIARRGDAICVPRCLESAKRNG